MLPRFLLNVRAIEYSKYKYRGFDTSRYLTIRLLIGYWNGAKEYSDVIFKVCMSSMSQRYGFVYFYIPQQPSAERCTLLRLIYTSQLLYISKRQVAQCHRTTSKERSVSFHSTCFMIRYKLTVYSLKRVTLSWNCVPYDWKIRFSTMHMCRIPCKCVFVCCACKHAYAYDGVYKYVHNARMRVDILF